MDHFTVTGTGTQTAGASQTVTITAIGNSGNTYAYTGNHTLVFSGANASPSATIRLVRSAVRYDFGTGTSLTFTNGVATCSMVLYKAEAPNINVSEGSYVADGHTLGVTVSPAAITSLDLSAPPAATSETAFSITINAKDAYGNVTPDVSQSMALSVNHGSIGPSSISSTNFTDDGTYTGDVTISQVYTNTGVTLTATLTAEPSPRPPSSTWTESTIWITSPSPVPVPRPRDRPRR